MSRGEHLFQIIVRCSNHAQTPRERILSRDTELAGVDAAIRELRRTRNTVMHGSDFDLWDLYDYDQGRAKRRLLRSGNVYGSTPSVQDQGPDHRNAPPGGGSSSRG